LPDFLFDRRPGEALQHVGQHPPEEQEPEGVLETGDEPILKLKELKVFSMFLSPQRGQISFPESAVTPTRRSNLLPHFLH
jgi:hypothetical protein